VRGLGGVEAADGVVLENGSLVGWVGQYCKNELLVTMLLERLWNGVGGCRFSAELYVY
jgi:hypothetical protein